MVRRIAFWLHLLVDELGGEPVEQLRDAWAARPARRSPRSFRRGRGRRSAPRSGSPRRGRRADCSRRPASARARGGSRAGRRASDGGRRACGRRRGRPGREAAALAQLVRRPLERRPLLHDERRGNLEVGERLSRGRQRVARGLAATARSSGRTRPAPLPAPGCARSRACARTGRRRAASSLPVSGSAAVVAESRKRPMPWPMVPSR